MLSKCVPFIFGGFHILMKNREVHLIVDLIGKHMFWKKTSLLNQYLLSKASKLKLVSTYVNQFNNI